MATLGIASVAPGQSPSCDPSNEVYFVVDGVFTYDNLFGGGNAAPPFHFEGKEVAWDKQHGEGNLGNPFSTFRAWSAKGTTVGNSLVGHATLRVHRYSPTSTWYGAGLNLSVAIYVKGGPGTPYFVLRGNQGFLQASKDPNDGWGSVSTSFNEFGVGTDGGITVSQFFPTLTAFTTGPTLIVDGHVYSYARTEAINMSSLVIQQYCACCGCPTIPVTLNGIADIDFTIDAGIGPIPCGGHLFAPAIGPCESLSDGLGMLTVSRRFDIAAEFDGNCGCCEYRQSVRRNDFRGVGVGSVSIPFPVPRLPNCHNQNTRGDCFVEDCDVGGTAAGCEQFVVQQGRRSVDASYASCRTSDIDIFGSGPSDRLTACTYAGWDRPSLSRILPLVGAYNLHAEFEGQIVVRKECLGSRANADRVIARRRWTIECSNTGDADSDANSAPDPSDYFFATSIANRSVACSFRRSGNLLVGTIALEHYSSDVLVTDSVYVTFGSLLKVPLAPPGQPLPLLSTITDSEVALADFAFGLPEPTQSASDFTITFGGVTLTLPIEIRGIGPRILGDFDRDGIVGSSDFSALLGGFGPCHTAPADANGDGEVNAADLTIVLGAWGTAASDGDINGDGVVDASDLTELLSAWGAPAECDDLTGDGVIDASDLAIFLSLWGLPGQ